MSSNDFTGGPGPRDLPTVEVGYEETEVRRRQGRDVPSPLFCYVDEDWHWHRVTLAVDKGVGEEDRVQDVKLLDYSDAGLAVSTLRALRPGARVGVVGLDTINKGPLFAEAYTVCNVRRAAAKAGPRVGRSAKDKPAAKQAFTFGAVVDDSLVEESTEAASFVYGLKFSHGSGSQVCKAHFDSIFLDYLRDDAGLDVEETLGKLRSVYSELQGGVLLRRADREKPSSVFCYIDDQWNWHRVVVKLDLGDGADDATQAVRLLDYSETGLAVSSNHSVPRGARIQVVGFDAIDERHLFEESYEVCDVRRPLARGRRSRPDTPEAQSCVVQRVVGKPGNAVTFIYGLKADPGSGSQVCKAHFDSLFLDHLREDAELDLEHTLDALRAVYAQAFPGTPTGS